MRENYTARRESIAENRGCLRKHALLAVALALFAPAALMAGVDEPRSADPRYCGEPLRDARGRISRRSDVLAAFKRLYACPATRKHTGPCPGWAIDHVIPLAVGGCDQIGNLQWLPAAIKSCAGNACKDRWERDVYRRL